MDVIRAAVAICTFNRADDCAATVDSLASDPLVADLVDDLYVTDQGTDLVETREAFAHAADEFGDRLHYLRQPNLGGAGGFSRGLYEATAPGAPGPVDVLLMDDDVRVEPESVLRLFAFAAVTREPTLVGAQMLYLYNPDYLLVSAEHAENLVVLKTPPGGANLLASAIDHARLTGVLGTIAGDDTIMIITGGPDEGAAVTAQLLGLAQTTDSQEAP